MTLALGSIFTCVGVAAHGAGHSGHGAGHSGHGAGHSGSPLHAGDLKADNHGIFFRSDSSMSDHGVGQSNFYQVPQYLSFDNDLDPGFSLDSQVPLPIVEEIAAQARRLEIPSSVLELEDWSQAPFLSFRKILPENRSPEGKLLWIGNVDATFDGLKTSLKSALDLQQIPFWGHDIGGFLIRGEQTEMPAELFIRWVQYAALTPVMRLHARRVPQHPWTFGEPITVSVFRDYAWLHLNLKPYFVSEFLRAAHRWGHSANLHTDPNPIVRSLGFEYPADSVASEVNDEYMLGPDILVAPILDHGRRVHDIYLPAGHDWIDFWSDSTFPGGHTIQRYPAPLEKIPIFIREGSVIPLNLDSTFSPCAPFVRNGTLTLVLSGNDDCAATIYTQTGSAISISSRERQSGLMIDIHGAREPVAVWIPFVVKIPRLTVGGRALARFPTWQALSAVNRGWLYDEHAHRVIIKLPRMKAATLARIFHKKSIERPFKLLGTLLK